MYGTDVVTCAAEMVGKKRPIDNAAKQALPISSLGMLGLK
jgi:hypothetical protein